MLERIIVTEEETNECFIHNNGLAKEWEKLANDLNGEIKGQVNGQILEFNLDFEIDKIKIHIYQIRQLSNKHTGTLLDDGLLLTKNTVFKIYPIDTKSDDWKLIKNNILVKFWYGLTGYSKPSDVDPNYLVISKRPPFSSDLLTQKELSPLLKMAELRFIIKKGSLLKIEFFAALGADSAMKIINSIIKTRP